MAKASEQFRQSDVTRWGIVALVCGAIAVLSANISAAMPSNMLRELHKTRIEGASLEQLRQQVADLRVQTRQLERENTVLTSRFALAEQQGNAVQHRVGALEVSLPRLLEYQPSDIGIDRTAVTASVGATGETQAYEADGGSVTVRQQPLDGTSAPQPLPDLLETASITQPNTMTFGIALGSAVPVDQAQAAWDDLSMKLSPLLTGMSPLLADQTDSDSKYIVAGPIVELSEATALCIRLERISIPCLPMPFTGTPLPD